jgi:hypothetical protein
MRGVKPDAVWRWLSEPTEYAVFAESSKHLRDLVDAIFGQEDGYAALELVCSSFFVFL